MDLKNLIESLKVVEQPLKKSESGVDEGLCDQVGKYVVVRTYYAGNWFGKLERKCGKEIYLTEARRLWRWFAKEGISLSGVATYGIVHSKSRIEAPLTGLVWLEAIEIIDATESSIESIKSAPNAEAE
jgi:hypothetical protein